MRTRTILAVAAITIAAAVGIFFATTLEPPQNGADAISTLEGFGRNLDVYDRQGNAVNLSRLHGKFVIIHFWATWCPPCVEEMPALNRFWARLRNNPKIELYSVSVDDNWKAIDDFQKKVPFDLPVFRDRGAVTAHKFGTRKFPETYIANPHGRILYHLAQAVNWDDPNVLSTIEGMLENP